MQFILLEKVSNFSCPISFNASSTLLQLVVDCSLNPTIVVIPITCKKKVTQCE